MLTQIKKQGLILSADLGGTKVGLGLYSYGEPEVASEGPALKELARERVGLEGYGSLSEILDLFLQDRRELKRQDLVLSLGVAGPVQGNKAKLTNRDWKSISLTWRKPILFRESYLVTT